MKNILYLTLLEVGEPLHSERKGLKSTLNDLCETDRKGGFLHQKKYEMFAGETGRRLGHRAPWTWRDGESL